MQEITVREAGRRGGTRTRELYGREFFRTLGHLGEKTVLARHGREHFVAAGRRGGAAIRERYGREYFQHLGQRGRQAQLARRALQEESPVSK